MKNGTAAKDRINVTVDSAIIRRFRESYPDINVSEICREALIAALCAMDTGQPIILTFSWEIPEPKPQLRISGVQP